MIEDQLIDCFDLILANGMAHILIDLFREPGIDQRMERRPDEDEAGDT